MKKLFLFTMLVTVLAALGVAAPQAAAQDKMYWTSHASIDRLIQCADLDGTNIETAHLLWVSLLIADPSLRCGNGAPGDPLQPLRNRLWERLQPRLLWHEGDESRLKSLPQKHQCSAIQWVELAGFGSRRSLVPAAPVVGRFPRRDFLNENHLRLVDGGSWPAAPPRSFPRWSGRPVGSGPRRRD